MTEHEQQCVFATHKMPNEETLRELYCDEWLSVYEIADRFSVGQTTVCGWMDWYGIERRSFYETKSGVEGHPTDTIHATVQDVWDRRETPAVKTAANDWPTFDAIVEASSRSESQVREWLHCLVDEGKIETSTSMLFGSSTEVLTVSPVTPATGRGADIDDRSEVAHE